MEILKSILQGITTDAPVTEVMRGLHWTVVASHRCGLASTMILDTCDKEKEVGRKGFFRDMTAFEFAQYCLSDDTSKASLGLAAINPLTDAKYQIRGCPASIACASAMTELAIGRDLDDAMVLSDTEIVDALNGLPGHKLHCSNLGAPSLKKAVMDHFERFIARGTLV